ncbi:DUF2171 domain-containing protein [Sphingomonas baiyangensis]|uniref:DUF2171 domain-containing protein n=1 Tax=Sphingomonas baiyangensis TaxID=2572576 RepID=A0A4U1L4N3_9SPHN|nr:DUF2171 domain-containing protein [Sphingomonas baiyangensis]TKD51136.1 DUF2171 domain-containing protein [Sphingomonas baiyangensis]
MGYERYPRGNDRSGNYYDGEQDYGRDYGSGRDYTYSSARDYAAGNRDETRGGYGDDRGRRYRGGRDEGRDAYGYGSYGARDSYSQSYGGREEYGRGSMGGGYGRDRGDRYASPYRGSYMSDGRRTMASDRDGGYRQQGYGSQSQGYGRQPQGYDYEDRGFMDRAGDEVRSWFGDDEAERRREMDRRYDERYARDEHYGEWRRQRIDELDRDYDEYRAENRQKFENEFTSFRNERQTQRSSLSSVKEHMEVVGSDGEHVGTVDKVRGDRIILTKNDQDAGGRHHSIPSRWIDSVDDKVKIRKTASEAQSQWRDEENNRAMFGEQNDGTRGGASDVNPTGRNLNRSFSGTY